MAALLWEELAADLARRLSGPVRAGAPMARYTTWRIGGPADLLAVPRSVADVQTCLAWASRRGVPWVAIGNGSNLLVLDGGVRGLVIRTAHGLNRIRAAGEHLELEAGVLLPVLLRLAVRHGWQGLEFAAGIPATVGGAVLMNAGTPEASIGELVRRVHLIDREGQLRELAGEELVFGYRFSSLQQVPAVITGVTLAVRPGGRPEEIAAQVQEKLAARRRKQPHGRPSAGSVFRNPPTGPPAGWLIEQVGAKGLRRGGAMVAGEHANFIVNTGGASAEDILALMAEIRRRVWESFGIELEPEIRILGEARG